MRAEGTFEVAAFVPATVTPPVEIATALPVGVATMEKRFTGGIDGRAVTIFTSAFDPATGVGTYVAMETFEGSLNGTSGAFAFVHAASTTGDDRNDEWFLIVPSSGTGDLAGIRGTGSMTNDHRVTLDYELD